MTTKKFTLTNVLCKYWSALDDFDIEGMNYLYDLKCDIEFDRVEKGIPRTLDLGPSEVGI